MNKRKILILIPSLVGGGAERTLINLLNKIDYDLYEITLVVVLKKGVYLNQVHNQVKLITLFANNFIVRVLSYFQKKTGFSEIFKIVIKLKVSGEFDVGICFLDSNFTDLLFFIKGLKKRFTWVHSSYLSYTNFSKFYKNKNYTNKLIKERYSELDGIVFVSKDSQNEFVSIFNTYSNMKVIYNFIDSEMVLKKSLENLDFISSSFNFTSIGSLLPVKGYDLLINAASILKERGYKFEVNIFGSGPEESKLKKMITEFNLEKIVFLRGYVNNPYFYLKQSDVFVMSSISEALPMVLCEAMVLRKPTLVTNCSGCRELAQNGEYGLVSERNEIEYANLMEKYLTDIKLLKYYSNKSFERSQIFHDEIILNECYQVFNS
jgi:glycosyltransferase involved in cell wall biosynthesis